MSPPDLTTPVADARLAEVIGAGADLLKVQLSDNQRDILVGFVRLLERWNATYNLTAIRDPMLMATHHILDCLAVVPSLRRHAGVKPQRILDVGSGAGLPGLVIAAVEPGSEVVCIDSVGKKSAFVAQAASTLGLRNIRSTNGRVEALHDAERFSVIVSRAFSSLSAFVNASRHLLQPDGAWMGMKGKVPVDELTSTPPDIEFHVEQLSVPGLAAERCLVWGIPLANEVGAGFRTRPMTVP